MNSKNLLLVISIFLFFSTYCYSQTLPRKSGLGLRYGISASDTSFQQNNTFYIGTYQNANYKINNSPTIRTPLFIQFDEDLITNWASSSSLITFDQINQKDIPPAPNNGAFDNSPNFDYQIKTVDTNGFPDGFSKYQSQIDSLSNPSLSADVHITNVNWIKHWSIFFPSGKYRILPIKLGVGLSYSYGDYQINLCDPYLIKAGLIDVQYTQQEPYQEGICLNKFNIIQNNSYHEIGIGISSELTIYSYIDENFEFNFFQQGGYSSLPSIGILNRDNLSPLFQFLEFNFISFVLYF